MAARRFEAVRQLFLDALDRPEHDREAFVHERAGADTSLGAEVLALLREHTDHAWIASDAPFAPEAAPDAIGPYRVLRELGRGGMGAVYLAQRGDEPPVAVKRAHGTLDPSAGRARFEREVATLASLDHPAIARFEGSGIESTPCGARPWFAMEYVKGVPLRGAGRPEGGELLQRLEQLAELADALQHAHDRGLVHRDVKPSNVLVRENGHPCLLDFGIARRLRSDGGAGSELTVAGLVLGTTPYMSPEQARGAHDRVDARSDLYSLAVTGFEWLTGELPHTPAAATHSAILLAIVTQVPRRLRDARRELPRALERVFAHALAREPAARYATAGAFADDLRRAVRGEPVRAPELPLVARMRRRLAWHRRTLLATGVLLLAVLAFQAPRAWRAMTVERREIVLTRTVGTTLFAVDPSVRLNDRTFDTIDAAAAALRALLPRLEPVRDEPWSVDLRRVLHWRLAELYVWRAEMSADRADHQEAIAQLEAMRALVPSPRRGVALRDSIGALGDLARFTMEPDGGLGLIGASYASLAEMERPGPNLEAARRLNVGALARRLGLAPDAPESLVVARALACTDSTEAYSVALHGLGGTLAAEAANTGDARRIRTGLAVMRRADSPNPRDRSAAPRASLHHSIGMAFAALAQLESQPAAVDSALRYFRSALVYRRVSPGNLSYFESRRGAVQALRARAALDPRRAGPALAQAEQLLEADLQFLRADAHGSHRANIQLQLARVWLDQLEGGLRTGPPARADSLLAAAGSVFEPLHFPFPAAQVEFERARLARLRGESAEADDRLDRALRLAGPEDAPAFARQVAAARTGLAPPRPRSLLP